MSLVCYNDYSDNISSIQQFLDKNDDIREECVDIFKESPKLGIVKLTEYLDKVNLWCPMLYKKNILREYSIRKGIK